MSKKRNAVMSKTQLNAYRQAILYQINYTMSIIEDLLLPNLNEAIEALKPDYLDEIWADHSRDYKQKRSMRSFISIAWEWALALLTPSYSKINRRYRKTRTDWMGHLDREHREWFNSSNLFRLDDYR